MTMTEICVLDLIQLLFVLLFDMNEIWNEITQQKYAQIEGRRRERRRGMRKKKRDEEEKENEEREGEKRKEEEEEEGGEGEEERD